MRAWLIIIGFFGGLIALCWYGATGETGPIGWLNGWQNAHGGSYSRVLSFGILCAVATVVGALALGLRALFVGPAGASPAASAASFTAPADAKIAAMSEAMTDRSRWRWRMYLKVWLVGLALIWASVLGWNGWDYQRRAADAGNEYKVLHLQRDSPAPRPDSATHWALQGRLLWDRSAVQTTKTRSRETETVYLPVAAVDWQRGDAVHFVLRLTRGEVWDLQHRTDAADESLHVRVEGALPTPSHAVFQKLEAPLGDKAVMVELVDRGGRPVTNKNPGFDWAITKAFGLGISAAWTGGIWLGALGVLLQVRRQQRKLKQEQRQQPPEMAAGHVRM